MPPFQSCLVDQTKAFGEKSVRLAMPIDKNWRAAPKISTVWSTLPARFWTGKSATTSARVTSFKALPSVSVTDKVGHWSDLGLLIKKWEEAFFEVLYLAASIERGTSLRTIVRNCKKCRELQGDRMEHFIGKPCTELNILFFVSLSLPNRNMTERYIS